MIFYFIYLSLAVSAFAVSDEDVIVARVLEALSEGLLNPFIYYLNEINYSGLKLVD